MSQEHAFYRSKTFNRRKIWLMFLAVFFRADVSGRTARLSDGLLLGILRAEGPEDLHERGA